MLAIALRQVPVAEQVQIELVDNSSASDYLAKQRRRALSVALHWAYVAEQMHHMLTMALHRAHVAKQVSHVIHSFVSGFCCSAT